VLNLLAGTPLQLGVQLWVLLVIPLGVLAASDAAQVGLRGWLAAFIALIVLAAIAPYIEVLSATAQNVLAPRCAPDPCYPDLGEQSRLMIVAPWIGAFLPVPLASLIYTYTSARGMPRDQPNTDRGELRLMVVCAVIGFVIMGALGYLAKSSFLEEHLGYGSVAQIMFVGNLNASLSNVWNLLLLPLPVAVSSLAMVDGARMGRRVWVAGWIVLAVLAVLVANLDSLLFVTATISDIPSYGWLVGLLPQLQDAGAVAPVVVMLVALLYAFTTRPRQRAAALAGA
jgi:hypothetical protein